VVGEVVVAPDGDPQLWQVCDGPADSCCGEYGDRLGDYVAEEAEGEGPVAVVEACGDRAMASCQDWAEVVGHTARVRVPYVLDRKRAEALSNC
jgi:hypothetical protein